MYGMRKVLFTLLFILFLSPAAFAQGEISLEAILAAPQREFKDEVNRLGIGIGVTGGYQFPATPVQIGAKFGFINYGVDRRNAPFSTTIPDVTVRVVNQYNMVQGHGYLRLTPLYGAFRPYVEGLAGFNYLFTQTAIHERGSNERTITDTNFDDTTFSYGIGGGFKVMVYDDGNQGPGSVYLDFRADYLFGNSANYMKKGSVSVENGKAVYDVYRSSTDMLLFQLGVSFTF